jgi:hypothetical protein
VVVKKIPKEHKGLYLCSPNKHGRQSNISEDTYNGVGGDTTLKPRAKCFHDTNGKMIKTIVASFKLRGSEKEIEKVRAQIASLSSLEEVISLYINTKEVENE